MGKLIVGERSFEFAVKIIGLCRHLQGNKEYVVSGQLIRSGTAIGALIREAEFAESRADFAHKMSIALKEANETLYWLALLKRTYAIDNEQVNLLHAECNELISMLVAIVKKTRQPR